MATITNPIAHSVIEMLRTLDEFKITHIEEAQNDELTEAQEKEAFLYTSEVNAAHNFAKHL